MDLLTSVVVVLILLWSFRFVQRKTTDSEASEADWTEEGKVVAWAIWSVMAVIATLLVLLGNELIMAGFFNPEYWALKQIIK